MAKKTKTGELFKPKAVSNFKDIDAELNRLETFVEDHDEIPDTSRKEVIKIVNGYRERINAKQNHLSNVGFFNTAYGMVNKFIESLTE